MLKRLSAREWEVILLIVEGLSNKEIARQLKMADQTVKVHLHSIYRKLAVRNRTMLAVLVAKLQAAALLDHRVEFEPSGASHSVSPNAELHER